MKSFFFSLILTSLFGLQAHWIKHAAASPTHNNSQHTCPVCELQLNGPDFPVIEQSIIRISLIQNKFQDLEPIFTVVALHFLSQSRAPPISC